LEYIEDAISDEEIAQGYALACQMVPKSDMVIDILASSAACKVKTEMMATMIVALEFSSSEIVKLVLKSKDGRTFNFLAGQSANIKLPTGESRSYSFSNVSGSDTAEFLIRLLPQGVMSDFLRETAIVGGTIWAKPYAEYKEAEIEKEIRRSLFPTLWGCSAVLPYFLAQGSGAIVNISSIATRGLNRVPYAAAKGGINALTVSLAMEYGEHNIRVNAIATGGTEAPTRVIPRNANP
jgi:hypothetical protein